LLFSFGTSRFHLTGAKLSSGYALEGDVPARYEHLLPESMVYYLAMREHIGLMKSLKTIPWRLLVYEGHQNEDLQEARRTLLDHLPGRVRVAASRQLADGDCGTRPILLLHQT
jgi:hypothetical protein